MARLNAEDFRHAARARLPRAIFDYVDGGADDELTLKANHEAFAATMLRPCVAAGTEQPDLTTTLFGRSMGLPMLTAPCGGMRLLHPDGDLGITRAASATKLIPVVPTFAGFTVEEITASAAGDKWFQLYTPHGRPAAERLIERVARLGFAALVCTVDTAVSGHRERDLRHGFGSSMNVDSRTVLRLAPQALRRPGWTIRFLRDGMPFEFPNVEAVTAVPWAPSVSAPGVGGTPAASPTWEDLKWIRDRWSGALLLKGILTASDTERAVALGADGVIVSNHGGRQLDGAEASMIALPEVVAAAAGRLEVLLDSGVRRGSDVVKALALGARAVLIGRPVAWGLATDGEPGARAVLEMLRGELIRTLQLLGCRSCDALSAKHVSAPGHAPATLNAAALIRGETPPQNRQTPGRS